MGKKAKVLSPIFAVVASLAIASSAFAAETDTNKSQNVGVGIKSGVKTLNIPTVSNFPEVTLTPEPQVIKTGFSGNFNIVDATGAHDGWKLNVSATPLTIKTTKDNTLPVGSLTIDPASSVDRTVKTGAQNGAIPEVTLKKNTQIDGGAVTVVTAKKGQGMGAFGVAFPTNSLSLTVDSTTAKASGTTPYETTLTWTLVEAP